MNGKIKEVIFDVDGTLVDTEQAILRSMQDALDMVYGKKYTTEELAFCLGIPGEDALGILGFTERIPEAMRCWVEQIVNYDDLVGLFEGIEPTVQALHEKGYGLGIVTSRTHMEFDEDIARYSIAPYFKTAVCADDTEGHKPSPDPLLYYMKKRGLTPEEVIYLGDSEYDLRCAEGAGVAFALAGWGAGQKVPARTVLSRPEELLSLLGED